MRECPTSTKIILYDDRFLVLYHWPIYKPKKVYFAWKDIKEAHAELGDIICTRLYLIRFDGKSVALDSEMEGWQKLLDEIPFVLRGFNIHNFRLAQDLWHEVILCWKSGEVVKNYDAGDSNSSALK